MYLRFGTLFWTEISNFRMYKRFASLFNEIDECITDLVHFCVQKASEGPYGMLQDSMVGYGVVRYGTMRYGMVRIRYGTLAVRVW